MFNTIRMIQQGAADKIWWYRRVKQLKRDCKQARRELQFAMAMTSPNGSYTEQIERERQLAQAKVGNIKQEASSLF